MSGRKRENMSGDPIRVNDTLNNGASKHAGILTHFQTKVNKKLTKNCQNFGCPELA